MDLSRIYDVLVLGGGNAALTAAITARRAGLSVLVLECSPKEFRGGNSRHTRNVRCMHDRPADVLTDAYPEEEYWQDLVRVTGGKTNEALARMTIRQSADCRAWMVEHGVRFQPSLRGTLHLSRTNAFFLGGGKALVNAYYRTAAALGIDVVYDAEVQDLALHDGRFTSATVVRQEATHEVRAKAVVAASGGFESNLAWLKEAWGDVADNFLIRGTPYNSGRVLRVLIDRGAQAVGDPTQCHAVACDARAPKFDGGIITRVDAISLGIVVNIRAERFYDEGEDFWPKRYAIWGRLVAGQPNQKAFAIIDAKPMGSFVPPVYPPLEARSVRELARALELDPGKLEGTVAAFNRSIRPGTFDHAVLDDCATVNLTPAKSHWARPLDTPPFFAYPLRPGITFTYLAVTVNDRAQVIMQDGRPTTNIFAAGEIMAGNVLGQGYLAGIGMTIGTIFGRIAGQEAARHVVG
ncbi:MAG TPA: FAD-dependent tricarballylate dehydrogenase TcuA [Candidatus Sulfotelmatobacter sp.]|nr:FAD-dependent tricarballylate dehydrogenase TcuA [Candidatus Sulfotelmatobacter sp.]